jgi:hypothetical protein
MALIIFLIMGHNEPLVINFRYAVFVFAALAVWLIGVVGEGRTALEQGLGTDDWNDNDEDDDAGT